MNYGDDTVIAGLGFNGLLPVSGRRRPQLAAELAWPTYQGLKGILAP